MQSSTGKMPMLLGQGREDAVGHLLGQQTGAFLGEVDVARPLDGPQPGQGERVEVVHPHAVFLHDGQGGSVVPLDIAFDPILRPIRNRSRCGEDQLGTRLLEPFDDLFQYDIPFQSVRFRERRVSMIFLLAAGKAYRPRSRGRTHLKPAQARQRGSPDTYAHSKA